GEVDAVWIQLEGRRTITLGPPVPPGTPEELPPSYARRRAGPWSTFELAPGTLFYMPPRTPHRVVYFERSAALSLTWGARRRAAGGAGAARGVPRGRRGGGRGGGGGPPPRPRPPAGGSAPGPPPLPAPSIAVAGTSRSGCLTVTRCACPPGSGRSRRD